MSIVIITGGSRGLGASAAIQCARRGMGVILTYNSNPQAAAKVVHAIETESGGAVALKVDAGDSAAFAGFREQVVEALDEIRGRDQFDALVNNAGYGSYAPIATVTEEHVDGYFECI